LSTPIYVRSQLRPGRLVRVGRTPVTYGDYWLLEATDRATAKARAAFIEWFILEAESLTGSPSEAAPEYLHNGS
jgi:hypothetical protein